jgi:hypothetical protein
MNRLFLNLRPCQDSPCALMKHFNRASPIWTPPAEAGSTPGALEPLVFSAYLYKAMTQVLAQGPAHHAPAFIRPDSAAMAEVLQWFTGKPEENFGLALASDTEA